MKGWKAPDWIRECLAEILGTGILLCFGTGSVAQAVLSGKIYIKSGNTGRRAHDR